MGWGSGVYVFDAICAELLTDKPIDKRNAIKALINALEDGDWDTHQDSEYYDDPIVQDVLKDLHPHWFEEGNF